MISFKRTKNRGFDLAILERAYVPNIASIDLEEFETATKPLHNVAGIYILYNKTSVYIGQAANLLSRLKDHKKNKIEFTKALVCFKNDENDDFLFDKGILDYLERSCISIVKERVSPGVFITNKNIGNTSPLEPSRKSKMGPVLGYMTEVLEHEYIIDYVIDQKLVQDKEIFVKITKDEDLPLPDKMDIVPLDFIEEKIKPIVDDAIDDEKLSEILVVQSASLLFPVVDKPNVNITFISTCEAGVLYAEEFSKQTGKELNIIKTTKDEFLSDLDMKTKFDVVIANPPYGQLYQKIYEKVKQISKEQIFVIPSRNVLLQQKSNDIISVELISAEKFIEYFNATLHMPGMIIHSSNTHNSEEINYTDQYGTKVKTTVKYITQCKFKGSKQIVDLVSNTQNNIKSYNKGKFEYHINMVGPAARTVHNSLFIPSKGLPFEKKKGDQISFKFETEKERYNFDQFIISKFGCSVVQLLKTNARINAKLLSKFPLPNDFKTFMTDDDIAKYFNLTQESIDFVNSINFVHSRRVDKI